MTRKSTTIDKARALFLTALMVLSVFGGSIALSGSAVAATNPSSTLDSSQVDAETTHTIGYELELDSAGNVGEIELDYSGTGTDVSQVSKADIISITTTGGNSLDSSDVSSVSASSDVLTISIGAGSQFEVSDGETLNVKLGKVQNPSETGHYEATMTVAEDDGTELDSGAVGFDITDDSEAATVVDFSASETDGPDIEVSLITDEKLSTSDISADVSLAGNTEATVIDFSEYVNDDGTYTYTGSTSGLHTDSAHDGVYNVTLTKALDTTSNSNDAADDQDGSVTLDTTGPSIEAWDPADGDVAADSEQPIRVNLTDELSEVDESSINTLVTVDATGNTIVDRVGVDGDGLSYDGKTLTVDPSAQSIPALPDGQINVKVSAQDTDGNGDADPEATGGNALQYSFDVDTGAPTISSVSPTEGTTVAYNDDASNSDSPVITADISDSNLDESTISVTITNETTGDEWFSGSTSDDGVSYGSGTLEVSTTGADVPETLPEGPVSVKVSAEDTEGHSITADVNFTVDTTAPTVESITVLNSPFNTDDVGEDQTVLVKFSEPVDASNVALSYDNDDDAETANKTGNIESSGMVSEVEATIPQSHLLDGTDDTVVVGVSAGYDDDAGNTGSANWSGSYELVSDSPTVTTSLSNNEELEGYINLDSKFDTSETADGNPVSYWITYDVTASDKSWQEVPQYFDTSTVSDGKVTLKANVTDDDGNLGEGSETVIIDNHNPSITVNSDVGPSVQDEVNFTNVFGVEYDDDNVEYKWVSGDSFSDFGSDGNTVGDSEDYSIDTTETTFSEDANITLGAKVMDDAGNMVGEKTVTVTVDNLLDTEKLETTQHDNGTFTLTFETDGQLDELNVSLEAANDFQGYEDGYDASTRNLTLGDFTPSETESGNYEYTTHVTNTSGEFLRDGEYDAEVDIATDVDGRTLSGTPSASGIIDGKELLTDHAFITDAGDGWTDIELQFNEPVSVDGDLSTSDIQFRDTTLDTISGSSVESGGTAGNNGVINVRIGKNIQTGDAPNLTVTDTSLITEAHNASGNNTLAEYDNYHAVGSVKLTLNSGMNTVSVPAASGNISADVFFEKSEYVESIWTYDAESNSWVNYNPDMDSEAPELEGGEGFIVMTSLPEDQTHTFSLQVNTLANDIPTEQHLEKGWNLVGHYQEGSQATADALESLNGEYTEVLTQDGGDYVPVTGGMQSGDGYWVYVTSDGVIYGENTDWSEV